MKDPFVSIIVITRNRPFLLRHCIGRVLSQPYPHKEIIVVDSSSNDESEQVVAQYPGVISVRLRGQRNNMPQARNQGIGASSGDILAFIDDDSMAQPDWLEALVKAYRDETIGSVGGRVIEMPDPYCDEASGSPRLFVKPSGRVIGKDLGLVSTEEIEVDHLRGNNMSFRREVLEQIGGFDANYTLTNFCEETDLCIRVKKAGWRMMFVPTMAVVHFSFRTIYRPYFLERPLYQFSNGRNSMYLAIKHFGLKPRTFAGQLIDTSRWCGRAVYFTFLFATGFAAHLAGRIVGLAVGITWHMNSQLRATSAPKIEKRTRAAIERIPNVSASHYDH
jgi:GT2 family glycosyltransferase